MSSERAASASRPIPTPLRVRWTLFRSRWLPLFTMVLCAVLSGWMWTRVAAVGQAVGEVERVRVALSSVVEGRLTYVDGKQVTLLQHVEEGDVIAKLDDAALQAQVAGAQADLKLLQGQLKAATTAGGDVTAANERAAALRVAVTAKEEQIAQLDGKIDSLVIKAPITGTVIKIEARPGQFVQAGQLIAEISAERGAGIVAFLRAEQRIMPREGMEVEVRAASDPYHAYTARVESVAGQYDALPARLLRDPKTPEWGVPVRITLPTDANFRPGELVRVTFRSRLASAASAVAVAERMSKDGKEQADASK